MAPIGKLLAKGYMSLPEYEYGSAQALAEAQGWKFRNTGEQLNIETCPFCGKGGFKFYLNNQNGLWDCKYGSCAEKGNFYTLQKRLSVEPDRALPLKRQREIEERKKEEERPQYTIDNLAKSKARLADDADALAYLHGRGFTDDTIATWHLGLFVDRLGNRRISIPYVEGNFVVDIKQRILPPEPQGVEKYTRQKGGKSILFGGHLMVENAGAAERPLYMCEGELDAITLWQHGFSPVISTTTGAQSFKPEWYDAISKYNPTEIFVCYDSDVAGQQNAKKIIAKFGDRKVVNVELPETAKDINEFFLTSTPDDFKALLAESEEADEPENVISFTTMANRLAEQIWTAGNSFDGVKSTHPEMNEMLGGGYWRSCMTLLSGGSGTGKTTFILEEFLNMAKSGIPVYFLCLEMTPEMMMRKIIQYQYGVDMKDIELRHIEKITKELGKIPFRYGFTGKNGIDGIVNDMSMAVRRYDSQMVAFDNVNFFVRSKDANQQQAELANVSKRLQETTKELRCHTFMIAQPKKFNDDERPPNLNDIKDTNALVQDSDNVVIMYRKPVKDRSFDTPSHDAKEPYCMFLGLKARWSPGGHFTLNFDGARSRFSSLDQPQSRSQQ